MEIYERRAERREGGEKEERREKGGRREGRGGMPVRNAALVPVTPFIIFTPFTPAIISASIPVIISVTHRVGGVGVNM